MSLLLLYTSTYVAIGIVLVIIAIWVEGELRITYVPTAILLVFVWPLLLVYAVHLNIDPWWQENKNKVLWRRRK